MAEPEQPPRIVAPEGIVLDDHSKPDSGVPPGIVPDSANSPADVVLQTPTGQTSGARPASAPTWAQQWGVTNPWATTGLDVLQGGYSGALSTVYHGGDLIRRALGMQRVINQPDVQAAITPPPGIAGAVGKGAEQAAEFFLPSEAVSGTEKVIQGATQIPRVVRAALQILPEVASSAGVTAAQTGGDQKAMELAALLTGGVKTAIPLVGAGAAKLLGQTTGAGTQAVEKAAEGSPEFVNAMRGNTSEADILGHLRDAMGGVKAERGATYQRQLAQLPSMQLDIRPLQSELGNALKAHNIGVTIGPNGERLLDFSRSTIRDATAQNQVLGIYNDVMDWGNQSGDLSPFGVDVLKRRIDDVYSESSNARAFAQRLKNQARGLLNDQVPGYQQMTRDYAQASEFLDNLKDLSLEAKNDGTAIRKFGTLMNQNNQFRQDLVNQLSRYAGRDLQAEIAGRLMNRVMPGRLGVGLDTLLGAAAWHDPSWIPAAATTALATSPRGVGEAARIAGKLAPGIPKLAGAIPSVIHVNPDFPTWNEQQNLPALQPPGQARGGGVAALERRALERENMLRHLTRAR